MRRFVRVVLLSSRPAFFPHRRGPSSPRSKPPSVRIVYFDGDRGVPGPARRAGVPQRARRSSAGCSATTRAERVTLLLADFADSGNAAAGTVPRNLMAMQIAPLNFAFETIAANERMTTLMNHELVHVVTMDQPAGRDRTFRRLFGGKVGADRRASRVDPLLLPDHAAGRRAALVPRGDRRLRRHLDGRRAGARAGRLRRDGLPRDGARRRAVLRSARPGVGRHEDRLPAAGRTRICTARGS